MVTQLPKTADKHRTAVVYTIITISVFVILVSLIYSNTFKSPFLFDDRAHIPDNPHIQITELNLKNLIAAAFKSPSPNRPVANISFALNYYFHKLNVIGYHCTNICIHILAGIFLYLLIKSTLSLESLSKKYRNPAQIAFFAALLWLVHPIQTQSVTYIVQRMNSMAGMFYILSLLLYVKGRLAVQMRKTSWLWFSGCVPAALLSFGCKEITATLPVFIILYEWYFFQDLNRSWLKRYLPRIIGVFIILGLLGWWYLGAHPLDKILSGYARWDFTPTERLLTQSRVLIYYISLLLYPNPARLNVDHDFTVSHSLINPPTTLLCIMAVIGLIGLAFYLAKKDRILSFSILWFFGTLVIESSVLGLQLVFEHRLYLPSMFVSLAFVLLVWRLIKQNWARAGVFCIIIPLFCVWTYQRNSVWTDPVTLWLDSAHKSPQKIRPYYNAGCVLQKSGINDEAIKYYNKALLLNPNHASAHINLGVILANENRIDEAIAHYTKALQIDPKSDKAYFDTGIAFYKQDKFDKALSYYRQALRINPGFTQAYQNIAIIFYQQNEIGKAMGHWAEALRVKADLPEILNNMAWIMATNEESKYRNPDKSMDMARRACEITDYQNPQLLDTLAAAYASAGKFQQAIETAEKAVGVALAADNKEMAKQIQSRLTLYQNQKPYRESAAARAKIFEQIKLEPSPEQVLQED